MLSVSHEQANSIVYIKAQGHSLQPHVDDRYLSDEIVCNLSMQCDATMVYCKEAKKKGDSPGPPISVHLPRRSLQIMAGEAFSVSVCTMLH
jgi:alkylated DNA repair dioxygenase AlkB